jgi:hypothetical protein
MPSLGWISRIRTRASKTASPEQLAPDPWVGRAIDLMENETVAQQPLTENALSSRLAQEEVPHYAWMDSAFWAERACRRAARIALRLRAVSLRGDEW